MSKTMKITIFSSFFLLRTWNFYPRNIKYAHVNACSDMYIGAIANRVKMLVECTE